MYIYLFINKTNGKKYVGQTITEPDTRFERHKSSANRQSFRGKQMIAYAICKYGWNGFTRHVLEVCESQEELDAGETYWINHYNCIAPNGYNLQAGGSGGSRGRVISSETRKKISDAGIGRKMSQEALLKSAIGRTGLKRSEEAKRKMSEAAKGSTRTLTDEQRLKKAETAKRVHVGSKRPEEAKQKMRDAAKNRKPVSEETRAKMSANMVRRNAEKRALKQTVPPSLLTQQTERASLIAASAAALTPG